MTRLLLALLFFFVAAPAHAQQTPLLKSSVQINAALVTLGDLFDHAGRHAETAVFRAPAPGTRGSVSTEDIAQAARQSGMAQFDLAGLRSVSVERLGLRLTSNALGTLVEAALQAQLETENGANAGRYAATLVSIAPETVMAGAQSLDELQAKLIVAPTGGNGSFVASIRDVRDREIARVEGRAIHQIDVPMLVRAIPRGDIIRSSDVRMMPIAHARATSLPTIYDPADLVGLAAARSLRVSVPINPDDVRQPALVQRQELVTLVYRQGGLALTVRARALDDGAEGQAVDVTNLQSSRIVRGIVTGRGVVQVTGSLDQLATLSLEQSQ